MGWARKQLFWFIYQINLMIVINKNKMLKYWVGWISLDLKNSFVRKILKKTSGYELLDDYFMMDKAKVNKWVVDKAKV